MPTETSFDHVNQFEDIVAAVEVPGEDDGRSYRRAILEIDEFYNAHPEHLEPSSV
jgi:hypothetical protein